MGQYFHDFIYPYVGAYGTGATTNKFWPALGNHDWAVIDEYLAYFTLPGNERYYEFARGPVHFFILDSDEHEADGYQANSVQAAWLQNAIAASPYPWKLVFLHNPPYTSGVSFGSNPAVQWPFKSWAASAVFSGHNHVYERIVPPSQGILFFVNGLGGSTQGYFDEEEVDGEQFRYRDDFGAMRVDATMSTITFQFRDENGYLIDTVSRSIPSISGNAGVAGATLSYTDLGAPQTATADENGDYSLTVGYNWSGTVTISKPGYSFTPTSGTYTNVLANQTEQDYTAKPDVIVYSSGAWHLYDFDTAAYTGGVWTGEPGGSCIPDPMDYNGDGRLDLTLLCGPVWHFYTDDGSYNKAIWTGLPGAVPVPADYDGDGLDEPVVFDGGAWQHYDFVTGSYDAAHSLWTGLLGGDGKPEAMDYNGDGMADPTILSTGGAWHFYNDDGTYNKGIWTRGTPGDFPVAGSYSGEEADDVVVFSSGAWQFFEFATGAYLPGSSIWTGVPAADGSGVVGPAPLDHNRDGKLDFTYYAGGAWHFYNADGGYNKGIWTGGIAGDEAISRRQLP